MKVILIIEGGCIQQIIADQEGLKIVSHDYDTDDYLLIGLSTDSLGDEFIKKDQYIDVNPEFILESGI
jgi:hypothetical protein